MILGQLEALTYWQAGTQSRHGSAVTTVRPPRRRLPVSPAYTAASHVTRVPVLVQYAPASVTARVFLKTNKADSLSQSPTRNLKLASVTRIMIMMSRFLFSLVGPEFLLPRLDDDAAGPSLMPRLAMAPFYGVSRPGSRSFLNLFPLRVPTWQLW